MFCVSLTNLITLSNVEYNRTILLGKKKKEELPAYRTFIMPNLLYTLIKINISLTNQNAASLPNVHTCNNVRVPGGIARGENGIRYPNVTDRINHLMIHIKGTVINIYHFMNNI
jgi:hypothetical protein